MYKSKAKKIRIKIIDIASDKVKVLKLVDEDSKAAGTADFKAEDLMNRIQDGEWELEISIPEEESLKSPSDSI